MEGPQLAFDQKIQNSQLSDGKDYRRHAPTILSPRSSLLQSPHFFLVFPSPSTVSSSTVYTQRPESLHSRLFLSLPRRPKLTLSPLVPFSSSISSPKHCSFLFFCSFTDGHGPVSRSNLILRLISFSATFPFGLFPVSHFVSPTSSFVVLISVETPFLTLSVKSTAHGYKSPTP